FGYALSAEIGQKIDLDESWTMTPQAQLQYASIDFDDFVDPFMTPVSLDRGDSLKARAGLSVDHSTYWTGEDGSISRSHFYGIANLHYEFLDGTIVDVAGTEFVSQAERLSVGAGLGGTLNWSDD